MLGRDGGQGSEFEQVMEAFGAAATSVWSTIESWFGGAPSDLDGFLVFLNDVFLPYLVGGMVPGLLAGFVSYWIIGPIVEAYQVRRRRKVEEAVERSRQAAFAEQEAYSTHDKGEGDNA